MISEQREVTARKKHICSFCGQQILPKKKYLTSTHIDENNEIYTWKSHLECDRLTTELKMYSKAVDEGESGVTAEFFEIEVENKFEEIFKEGLSVSEKLIFINRGFYY